MPISQGTARSLKLIWANEKGGGSIGLLFGQGVGGDPSTFRAFNVRCVIDKYSRRRCRPLTNDGLLATCGEARSAVTPLLIAALVTGCVVLSASVTGFRKDDLFHAIVC